MKRYLPAGARLLLAALGMLVGTAGGVHATCRSACLEQRAECKSACPVRSPDRTACRTACVARSTCTAPDAPIPTVAYVVNECTTDPQQRSSLEQKLVVRRGNCDPVTVMEARTPTPVFDPIGVCRLVGTHRLSYEFVSSTPGQLAVGVFQALVALRDGSGAVFNVSKQFAPFLPGLLPEPPDEGIFFVRADGSGLRRLGPPSRVQSRLGSFRWASSPDGRRIAFVDLGMGDAGYEAPQVWLLDLPACLRDQQPRCRRQLTRQSTVPVGDDPGVWFPAFVTNRTVAFATGSTSRGTYTAWQVRANGSHLRKAFSITNGPARIVPTFGVTGKHPTAVLVPFPEIPAVNPSPSVPFAREVFAVLGKYAIQLTKFDRSDTAPGAGDGRGVIVGDRLLFLASADAGDAGENPDHICQVFSTNTRGGEIRQVTHLPSDGRSPSQGCRYPPPGCGITIASTAVDRRTGTVLFSSSCDPLGTNPFGEQIFAMRPDGTRLHQLTNARGMTTDPDGTLHVELAGPFASR
jgi:hypothetical protein